MKRHLLALTLLCSAYSKSRHMCTYKIVFISAIWLRKNLPAQTTAKQLSSFQPGSNDILYNFYLVFLNKFYSYHACIKSNNLKITLSGKKRNKLRNQGILLKYKIQPASILLREELINQHLISQLFLCSTGSKYCSVIETVADSGVGKARKKKKH